MSKPAANENKLVNTVNTKQQKQHWRAQRWKWWSSPNHVPQLITIFSTWTTQMFQTESCRADPALNASLSRCYLWHSFPNYDPRESSESRVESAKCSTRNKTPGCVIEVPAGSVWIHWSRNSPDSDPELLHCCLPPPSPPTWSCDCGDDSWHHSYKIRALGWRRRSSCAFILSLTVCFAGSLSLSVFGSSERVTACSLLY